MITEKEINMMKKGAQIINNARGDTINVDHLVSALANGQLGGAAVDVFPEEPLKNGGTIFFISSLSLLYLLFISSLSPIYLFFISSLLRF